MFKKNIEYILHDTSVNDIIINDYGLTFLFQNGVYVLDDIGKEAHLSKPCKISFFVEYFNKHRLFEHCTFYKCHKTHFSEVDISEIKKLLLKNHFNIDLDFYSPVANAISIKGDIGKYMVEMIITEIQSIKFETI